MKIRIKDNTFRVRLSMDELSQLAKGVPVSMTSEFGGVRLVHQVIPTKKGDFNMEHSSDGKFSLFCPLDQLLLLHGTGQEGIEGSLSSPSGKGSSLFIQKDYKCIGRDEVANEGLFPNPKNNDLAC